LGQAATDGEERRAISLCVITRLLRYERGRDGCGRGLKAVALNAWVLNSSSFFLFFFFFLFAAVYLVQKSGDKVVRHG